MGDRYAPQSRRDRDQDDDYYGSSRVSKPRARSQVRINVPESVVDDEPPDDRPRRKARFGGDSRQAEDEPTSSDRPALRRRKSVDLERKTSKEDEAFRRRRDQLEAEEARNMRRSEELPRVHGRRGEGRDGGGRYDDRERDGERRKPRDDDEGGRDGHRRRHHHHDYDESRRDGDRRRPLDDEGSRRDGEKRRPKDDDESRRDGHRRRYHDDGESRREGERRRPRDDDDGRRENDRRKPRSDDESKRADDRYGRSDRHAKKAPVIPPEISDDAVSYGSGPVDHAEDRDRAQGGKGAPPSVIGLPRAPRDPRDRDDRDSRPVKDPRDRDDRDFRPVGPDAYDSRKAEKRAMGRDDRSLGSRPDSRDNRDYDSRDLADRPPKYAASKDRGNDYVSRDKMNDLRDRDDPPRRDRRRDDRSEY